MKRRKRLKSYSSNNSNWKRNRPLDHQEAETISNRIETRPKLAKGRKTKPDNLSKTGKKHKSRKNQGWKDERSSGNRSHINPRRNNGQLPCHPSQNSHQMSTTKRQMCSKSEKFFPAIARVLIVDAFHWLSFYMFTLDPRIRKSIANSVISKGGFLSCCVCAPNVRIRDDPRRSAAQRLHYMYSVVPM